MPVKVELCCCLHGWFEEQPPDNRFVLLSIPPPWETPLMILLLLLREYLDDPLLGRKCVFFQYSQRIYACLGLEDGPGKIGQKTEFARRSPHCDIDSMK